MYCQNCGIEINKNQKICSNCGNKNSNFKKKFITKKHIIISILIIITLFICLLIYSQININKHKALIKQVSDTQLDLYQHKLIPTLMGEITLYKIQDVKCSEVSPEGKAKYAIGLDCNILIGDKTFQYPIAVLFNDDSIDKPQYIHDTGIEKEIIDYEKEYKSEQEKKQKLNQVIKISGKDLYNAYDKNEVDANSKYTGKTGMITGKIDSINVNGGSPNIRLEGGTNTYFGVVCYFKDNSLNNKLSKLKKGQTITISGEIKGKTFVDVTLDNCTF